MIYGAKKVVVLALISMQLLASGRPVEVQQRNLRLTATEAPGVTKWPSREKRYALLIGVNSYENSQITPLVGAVNDMILLEEALVRYGGFDRDRVIRLTSDSTVPDSRPTYGNILYKLSNILKAVPSDGLLLLAFSGHGIERNRRAFLLPIDARVNSDIDLLESTALEVARIKRMIENRADKDGRQTGVAQVVVLLDACRNDPTSGKDVSKNPLTSAYDFALRNSKVQAFATIYATSRGFRAYEDKARKRGYFIAEVVAGLSGEAANDRGEVTLDGLIRHVENKVPVKVILDQGDEQKPFMELQGYRAADLVISFNNALANTRPARESRLYTPTSFTTGVIVDEVLKTSKGECEVYTEDLGNGVLLEMVRVPGGEFLMGEDDAGAEEYVKECERWTNDKAICQKWAGWQMPQHRVKVKEFLMGRYEVTQRQWRAVMGGLPPGMERLEEKFKSDDKPVVSVSWDEVQEFMKRLGKGYRLPSEAEWEYAARAGTTTAYAFGETITSDIVNYDGNYPAGTTKKGRYREIPILVGALPIANGFGLYDMHGNVWEWCEDEFYQNYSEAPTDGSAWNRSAEAAIRVIRGGSWFNGAVDCRSARRYWDTPGHRYDVLGFRLSRTLP